MLAEGAERSLSAAFDRAEEAERERAAARHRFPDATRSSRGGAQPADRPHAGLTGAVSMRNVKRSVRATKASPTRCAPPWPSSSSPSRDAPARISDAWPSRLRRCGSDRPRADHARAGGCAQSASPPASAKAAARWSNSRSGYRARQSGGTTHPSRTAIGRCLPSWWTKASRSRLQGCIPMRPTESEAHTSPRRAPQTSRSCTCGKLNTSREPMADGAECSVWTGNRRWRRAASVTLSVQQGPACPDRPSAVCPVVEPHRSTSRRDARASLASPVRAEWLSRGDFGFRNRSVGD